MEMKNLSKRNENLHVINSTGQENQCIQIIVASSSSKYPTVKSSFIIV